jgi:hypothetical protein
MGNEWELIARACGRTVTEARTQNAWVLFQRPPQD